MLNLLAISAMLFYFIFFVTLYGDPYYIFFSFILVKNEFSYKNLLVIFCFCIIASGIIYADLALDNIIFLLPFYFFLKNFSEGKASESDELIRIINNSQFIIVPACLIGACFTYNMGQTLPFVNFKLSKIISIIKDVVLYAGNNFFTVYEVLIKNLHIINYVRYQQCFIFEYYFMSRFYTAGIMPKVKMNPLAIIVFFISIFVGLILCLLKMYFLFYLNLVLIGLIIGYISAFGELRLFSTFGARRQGFLFSMIFRQIIYNFIYYFTQNDFSSLNFSLTSRNRFVQKKTYSNYTDYVILFFFVYEIIYQLVDFLQDVKDD